MQGSSRVFMVLQVGREGSVGSRIIRNASKLRYVQSFRIGRWGLADFRIRRNATNFNIFMVCNPGKFYRMLNILMVLGMGGEGAADSRIKTNVQKLLHFHGFGSGREGAPSSRIIGKALNVIHFHGFWEWAVGAASSRTI